LPISVRTSVNSILCIAFSGIMICIRCSRYCGGHLKLRPSAGSDLVLVAFARGGCSPSPYRFCCSSRPRYFHSPFILLLYYYCTPSNKCTTTSCLLPATRLLWSPPPLPPPASPSSHRLLNSCGYVVRSILIYLCSRPPGLVSFSPSRARMGRKQDRRQ
jgi:hypothetical protein